MLKRVVLKHSTGLYQILGTTDQLQASLKEVDLPTFLDGVDFFDHKGSCSLITVKTRYVLYRENIQASTISDKTFNPSQL